MVKAINASSVILSRAGPAGFRPRRPGPVVNPEVVNIEKALRTTQKSKYRVLFHFKRIAL